MDGLERIEAARNRYKPSEIKILLIGEAPPKRGAVGEAERFFYFPSVSKHDNLFLRTMEVIYPRLAFEYQEKGRPPELKEHILRRFQADGYFLIDLFQEQVKPTSKQLREAAKTIVQRVDELVTKDTPIIVMAASVYKAAFQTLSKSGHKVVDCTIHFPMYDGLDQFRQSFPKALSIAQAEH